VENHKTHQSGKKVARLGLEPRTIQSKKKKGDQSTTVFSKRSQIVKIFTYYTERWLKLVELPQITPKWSVQQHIYFQNEDCLNRYHDDLCIIKLHI
jgi:hypothetical protein